MPIARVLRLGLRQFAGGMLSVLTLGILNRVMKVEMGLDLAPVALVIGAHYLAAASFALLTISAGASSRHLVTQAILLMGLGTGLFNVGGLALMMGMTGGRATGLYMGALTMAQALANGLASIGGGAVFRAALGLFREASAAYASVFGLEAVGLCVTVWLLRAISLP